MPCVKSQVFPEMRLVYAWYAPGACRGCPDIFGALESVLTSNFRIAAGGKTLSPPEAG